MTTLITASVAGVYGFDVNDAAQGSKTAVTFNAITAQDVLNLPSKTIEQFKETVKDGINYFDGYGGYFKDQTNANLLNTVRKTGESAHGGFAYIEGGMNIGGIKVNYPIVMNVHNGNLYIPNVGNAGIKFDSKPSAGITMGIGKVITSIPAGSSRGQITDLGLNGYGGAGNFSGGAISATYASTVDGTVKMLSVDVGKEIGGSNKKVGLEISGTGMKKVSLSNYGIKYDSNSKKYISLTGWGK